MEFRKNKPLALIIFISTNLIFIMNEWRFNINNTYFPLSDILAAFLVALVFCVFVYLTVIEKQIPLAFKSIIKTVSLLFIFLIGHMLVQYFFNPNFVIVNGFISTIKLIIYGSFIAFVYYYYKNSVYRDLFYKVVEISAIIVALIGIYIGIMLYLSNYFEINKSLYEFFWTFTRKSPFLSIFRRTNIIRLRSVFSEPSYYGTYLNVILMLFYFNKNDANFTYKISRPLFVISLLMTFALSALGVYFIIEFLYLHKRLKNKSKVELYQYLKNRIWVFVLLLLMVFLFRNPINTTIIQRIKLILAGGDGSAFNRLFSSWTYVDHPLIGNGIGQTPAIWNNLAYILSDFGYLIFIVYLFLLAKILKYDLYFLISFLAIHFAKGGYLSAFNYMTILFILMFKNEFKRQDLLSTKLKKNRMILKEL